MINCPPYFYDASNPWINGLNGVYYRKEDADKIIDDLNMSVALYEKENQYLISRIRKMFDAVGNIQDDEWGMDIVDIFIKRLENK